MALALESWSRGINRLPRVLFLVNYILLGLLWSQPDQTLIWVLVLGEHRTDTPALKPRSYTPLRIELSDSRSLFRPFDADEKRSSNL